MKRDRLEEDASQAKDLRFVSPSWTAAVLVCRQCCQRSSGPKKLKSKAVASALKDALRNVKPRPRLLLTSCIGLCPKKAIAVAVAGGPLGTQIAAVQSLSQLKAIGSAGGLVLPAQSITCKPVQATPATAIIGTVIVPGT